ncbi:hypothetical protein ACBJ59_62445 [Nonomuraea sp. MTCD27]
MAEVIMAGVINGLISGLADLPDLERVEMLLLLSSDVTRARGE